MSAEGSGRGGSVRPGSSVRGVERLACDVVVVGSGAGGAAAAYELAAAGLEVCVLEAGPHIKPEEFTQRELDTIKRVWVDQGAQGPEDGSIQILQGRCVGGSTVINAEVAFRIPDKILDEVWAREFGVRGMGARAMAPVFEHVERMVNVTVNEGRFLASGARFAQGLVKLGLEPKPLARNVKGCRGCNYCLFGCAYGCKQSMDQSYLPAAMARGATVVSDARVERIDFEGRRAAGVSAKTPEGRLEVRARAVVLACGAIETPLMLLDHRLGGFSAGRNLALHPALIVIGEYDEPRTTPDSPMLSSYSDAWVDDGFVVELGAASPAFVAGYLPGFGAAHKALARDTSRWSIGAAIVRDTGATGRVARDRRGRKVITYGLEPAVQRSVRRALRTLAEIALASGARRVSFPTTAPCFVSSTRELDRVVSELPLGPADIGFLSYHPQGTARLGTVTDHDGQVREAEGLYVMDASLFPAPVGVNTQVPVMAVSTVLARRLADRLRAAR